MLLKYGPILIMLSIFAVAAFRSKKLTPVAGITGWVTGLFIFAGAGYTGVAMLAAFFILGTAATSIGMHKKQNLNLAEKDKGRRSAEQVIANAGVAATLGLLILVYEGEKKLLIFMIAASLASATADTL